MGLQRKNTLQNCDFLVVPKIIDSIWLSKLAIKF